MNTSNTCVNVEFKIERDHELSNLNFEDNFKQVDKSDTFLFVDCGNFDNDFDKLDISNYNIKSSTKKSIIQWFKCNYSHYQSDLNDVAMQYFDTYFCRLTKLELIELGQNLFDDMLLLNFLESNFTRNFEVLTVKGYSQGDVAQVVFRHVDINEYNFEDREEFMHSMSHHFTNIFYNSPLHMSLIIDDVDQDIQICDLIEDEFEYDRDEILKALNGLIVHEKKHLIMDLLSNELNEYL